jgi:amino-acid N-acetyltransferase
VATIANGPPPLTAGRTLLAEAELPLDEVDGDAPLRFFGIERDRRWTGVIGIEWPGGDAALLRSPAVAPDARGRRDGRARVAAAEAHALMSGLREVYLLTTSAAGFFGRLGYRVIDTESAPASVRATRQFTQR